jgi:hypothetical protein
MEKFEQVTVNNIKKSSLNKIGKILGISFQTGLNPVDTLLARGKTKEFNDIITFMNDSGRDSINSFIFKVQKTVSTYVKKNKAYVNVDLVAITKQRDELENVKYNQRFQPCSESATNNQVTGNPSTWENDKNFFLSLDIRSANYTVLAEVLNINVSWTDFLKQLVPFDVRTGRVKNEIKGISGKMTTIPECIYESKWFRTFLLGKCRKLQVLWEIKNLTLLQKVINLNIKNRIYVNSDEIIIKISDYKEGRAIVDLLDDIPDTFRVRKFQIKKVTEYSKNCVIKIFENKEKRLVNVMPQDYIEAYNKFILLN